MHGILNVISYEKNSNRGLKLYRMWRTLRQTMQVQLAITSSYKKLNEHRSAATMEYTLKPSAVVCCTHHKIYTRNPQNVNANDRKIINSKFLLSLGTHSPSSRQADQRVRPTASLVFKLSLYSLQGNTVSDNTLKT